MQIISDYQKRNYESFTLIELSFVIIVIKTTMEIGINIYQGMQENEMLEAAKKSLYDMKSEFERTDFNKSFSFCLS